MNVQNSLRIGGAVIFWTIGQATDRKSLKAGFDSAGFEKFVPEARSPAAAIRDALEEMHPGSTMLVRPLKTKDGFTVVQEGRGEHQNDYTHICTAKIDPKSLQISLTPFDYDKAVKLTEKFNAQLGLLCQSQVSTALVNILGSLGGTRLRPTGAMYWLPDNRLNAWLQAAHVVELSGVSGKNSVYCLRHQLDADAVRAVRDAVVQEVSTEAGRIQAEVLGGGLGERALLTRQVEAEALRDKIKLYEELLQMGLGSLHTAVDQAETAAAAAVVLASSAGTEVAAVG